MRRMISLSSGSRAEHTPASGVGLRNFASSESLPGVCPNPPRQGALDAEHV